MAVAHGKIELIYLILQHLLHGGVSRQRLQAFLSPLSLTILFRRNCVLNYLLNQQFHVNIATPRTGKTVMLKYNINKETRTESVLTKIATTAKFFSTIGSRNRFALLQNCEEIGYFI